MAINKDQLIEDLQELLEIKKTEITDLKKAHAQEIEQISGSYTNLKNRVIRKINDIS